MSSTIAVALPTIADSPVTDARVRRFYSPELDALRFGAFLLVFCRHVTNSLGQVKRSASTGPLTSATSTLAAPATHQLTSKWTLIQGALQSFDFGVCLFFFLSSFLITRLLLIERERTGTVSVGRFYLRRCLRIWPLYFSFLALSIFASHFISVLHVETSRVLVAALFVANWAVVLHGWQSIAIQPLWSVSIEEQFYLVWPLFARIGKRSIVALSCLAIVASLGSLIYLGQRPGTLVTEVWPNTFVQAIFLAAGALTACYSHPEHRRASTSSRAAVIVIGFIFWIVASAGFHVVRFQSPGSASLVIGYLFVLGGTFCIFSGVAGWKGAIPSWLIQMGKMSYGLYVFHAACILLMESAVFAVVASLHRHVSPLLQVASASVLGFMLTVVCAWISYTWLETPFLHLKERFTAVPSRPS